MCCIIDFDSKLKLNLSFIINPDCFVMFQTDAVVAEVVRLLAT